ncbi:DUF6339 family protein [Desulfosporosinus sp. SYSU MS00001]|uniref:DUF6339 family protein n=1 Tax=Desulfosporosinus sp. SYSU MS00001 TaxID=3416284 RepID=UPI003CE966B6
MKLYFLKEEALETLKGNIKTNLRNYSNITNDWIINFFNGENPFIEYKKEVNDFKLSMTYEKPEESDIENIKIIYPAMSNISETDATDERLWSGLEHSIFWDYLRYRWSTSKKQPSDKDILNHYFFSQYKKRSLITNTLAKLWWIGKLTYDIKRKNPFELTEYLKHDFATKIRILFSSNFSNNPKIVRSLLSSLIKLEHEGFVISREVFIESTKYLNVLGGTYILDYFEEEELSEKLIKRITALLSDNQR